MIKIAFCDDEASVLKELCELTAQYRAQRNREIDCIAFHSPLELMVEIERGKCFDIIFLDVIMPGENGMDTAQEIRNYDSNVKIIFLTSSSEYAVQSYTVGAYYYQLKPVSELSFFRLMDAAVSACDKERSDSLILRCKSGIARIELRKVEYCEVIHRTLFLHLTNGEVLESIGSLDELSRRLELYGGFVRPHRSYLVNLEHVRKLSYRAITMRCMANIPIPRGKYQELKQTYLEYAFQSRQVMM